jgi:hypothetical protein
MIEISCLPTETHFKSKNRLKPGMVAQDCCCSYSGGWDQEDPSSRSPWANSLQDLVSEISNTKSSDLSTCLASVRLWVQPSVPQKKKEGWKLKGYAVQIVTERDQGWQYYYENKLDFKS